MVKKTSISPTAYTGFRIAWYWLILDVIGMMLVGLGAAEQLGRLALPVHFAMAGVVLMVLGVALMLPLVWQIRLVTRQAQAQDAALLKEYLAHKQQQK